MIISWIIGLARTRTLAFVGTVLGIAVTTGLVTALGAFSKLSSSEMTTHAVSTVPIDWQAEFAPDLPADGIIADMRGAARIEKAASVGYASIDGLEAATKGTVQTTGPGKILGIDPDYTANFPNNIRPLLGQISGVLIAQQTAANLHVGPGDSLTIHRPALPDIRVRID
ncbi:MAG: ABC transporter permease, partial [Proteobacteria bacterium]|nr:ABC transporter permease [Pseudomonadota bacterium]